MGQPALSDSSYLLLSEHQSTYNTFESVSVEFHDHLLPLQAIAAFASHAQFRLEKSHHADAGFINDMVFMNKTVIHMAAILGRWTEVLDSKKSPKQNATSQDRPITFIDGTFGLGLPNPRHEWYPAQELFQADEDTPDIDGGVDATVSYQQQIFNGEITARDLRGGGETEVSHLQAGHYANEAR
ncbi:unnamed protein product [Discula destructiva]